MKNQAIFFVFLYFFAITWIYQLGTREDESAERKELLRLVSPLPIEKIRELLKVASTIKRFQENTVWDMVLALNSILKFANPLSTGASFCEKQLSKSSFDSALHDANCPCLDNINLTPNCISELPKRYSFPISLR